MRRALARWLVDLAARLDPARGRSIEVGDAAIVRRGDGQLSFRVAPILKSSAYPLDVLAREPDDLCFLVDPETLRYGVLHLPHCLLAKARDFGVQLAVSRRARAQERRASRNERGADDGDCESLDLADRLLIVLPLHVPSALSRVTRATDSTARAAA